MNDSSMTQVTISYWKTVGDVQSLDIINSGCIVCILHVFRRIGRVKY